MSDKMHRFLGKDPNGLAQGDFAEIARLLPEVYRAAAGRWMSQPQVQPQAQPQVQPQPQPQSQAQPQPVVNPVQQNMQIPNAQPSDLGVQPSQGLTAQNPQQPQVQAVPSAEDLTDIRQKLAALDTMMQGNPASVEARRRGDWQTAAREAEKAGHHDLARVYQMLHEKMTGAPLNVTPYQNPAAKAGDEQGAARPTPAPVPVHPVNSLHPVDIPKSVGARRDFGRGLIKAMRMRNIPIVDTLKEGLRDGKKDALKHALKRIAQADEEDAILRGETAAQRANDGDEAQAESREKQGDEVQAKSAQNEGKEKTADEGGAGVEENIARGMRAMQKVIETHEDVHHAMYRDDTGAIDFIWGFAGKGEKFKQGYGVAHILAKHVPESGEDLPYKIVETIAKGKITRVQTLAGSSQPRLVLEHDGYTAILSLSNGENSTWLLTGWEDFKDARKRASSANGEGNGSTAATATAPMRTRRDGEDALSSVSTIPSEQEKSKEKSVQAKSAPLTKQEQEALTGTSEEAKDAYRIVRDKLAKSKNKAVVRAAKVGATLFARHADIYAKAYSKATGKPYTALDYLHDKFGLDADGKEADGRADGLGQRTSADVPASQKEAVRKQYAGTALWMKAPNGKATNLTEDQWLTVRTPAFKAWFGDWEQVAEKQKYLHTEPIAVAEGQIAKTEGSTAREAAMAWAAEHLPVQVMTRFGEVEINRASIKDSLGHGFSQKKLDAITSLPEGMAVAAFINEKKDFDGADIDNGYFCYPMMYQGERQVVFCRVRRDMNSNKLYVHEVFTEDEIKGIPLQAAAKFSNSKPHGGNVLYKSILTDFLNKDNAVSKVVDENGEPLVVYHATLAEFTKFRPSESGMYGKGIYLTADKEDTSYTLKDKDWRVMELFANIRNPRDPEAMATREDIEAAKKEAMDFFEKHPFDKDGTPASFVVNHLLFWGMQPGKVKKSKLTQVLQDAFARKGVAYQESDKHDGAIIRRDGATWYTADQPNQVKSATGNTGAFSAADEDVYHQSKEIVSRAEERLREDEKRWNALIDRYDAADKVKWKKEKRNSEDGDIGRARYSGY